MAVLTEHMRRVVREQRLGFVATVCEDGTPNLSPKGTLAVWDDDTLVFADLRSPRTVANLRTNPAVEINVVDVFNRKGYRFKGRARVLTEGQEFERAVALYRDEDAADRLRDVETRVKAFVLVSVERALPLVSPGYDDGRSEAEMVAEWMNYWSELLPSQATTSSAWRSGGKTG